MKKIVFFLLLISIAISLLACPFSRKQQETAIKKAAKNPGVVILSRKVGQTTPKGAKHFGAKPISDQQLRELDGGLDDLFREAAEDGFLPSAIKPHSFFEVFTPPYDCVLAPESRVPAFLVGGGYEYDGTIYDQYNTKGQLPAPKDILAPDGSVIKTILYKEDGLSAIFAAEMILSLGTPGSTFQVGQMYVCPGVMREGTKNGGEHIYLGNFSYTEEFRKNTPFDGWTWFNRSLFHGGGLGHPLLPRGERFADISQTEEEMVSIQESNEQPLSGDSIAFAKELGVSLTGNETEIKGTKIIRAVK